MVRVGIIGGAGYTAGELLRILVNHPQVEIKFVNSTSNAGNYLYDVHEGLFGETDIKFTDELPFDSIDAMFICSGHGDSKKFLESHDVPANVKIIDLSQDYRDQQRENQESHQTCQPRLFRDSHPDWSSSTCRSRSVEERNPH